jgi:uncharacterized protein
VRAISNSSVLIALSSIGQLPILAQRFPDGILIPRAVWHEVVETGAGRSGARDIAAGLHGWLFIQEVEHQALIQVLKQDLDQGEAEAIALMLEQPSAVLLLDEKKARSCHFPDAASASGSRGRLEDRHAPAPGHP